jgi:hypothetical protein
MIHASKYTIQAQNLENGVGAAPCVCPLPTNGLGLLQILGYVLVFIGSVPAAIAMLKLRDGQA